MQPKIPSCQRSFPSQKQIIHLHFTLALTCSKSFCCKVKLHLMPQKVYYSAGFAPRQTVWGRRKSRLCPVPRCAAVGGVAPGQVNMKTRPQHRSLMETWLNAKPLLGEFTMFWKTGLQCDTTWNLCSSDCYYFFFNRSFAVRICQQV